MNPEDMLTPTEILFDSLYKKATKIVVDKHTDQVNAEYSKLHAEVDYRVGFVRLFAQSHANKPFPKILCIKLVRHAFRLNLIEAKELVDYAIEVIPEFKQDGTVKLGDYLRYVPKI